VIEPSAARSLSPSPPSTNVTEIVLPATTAGIVYQCEA